jgi:hypothetical protein
MLEAAEEQHHVSDQPAAVGKLDPEGQGLALVRDRRPGEIGPQPAEQYLGRHRLERQVPADVGPAPVGQERIEVRHRQRAQPQSRGDDRVVRTQLHPSILPHFGRVLRVQGVTAAGDSDLTAGSGAGGRPDVESVAPG